MPPSGVDYASRFLNGYAPEYVVNQTKRGIVDSIGESVPLYHSNRYHHITLIGTTVSLESVPTFILVLSINLNSAALLLIKSTSA